MRSGKSLMHRKCDGIPLSLSKPEIKINISVKTCLRCLRSEDVNQIHSPRMHFVSTFAKLRKTTVSFVMSVCPHGTLGLPLDGF